MGVAPRIENYDIKILVALGNQTDDIFNHNHIKNLIVKKLLDSNYSLFFLLTHFIRTNEILKEAYAEVITMTMKDSDICIDENIVYEIVKLVSIDTLMYYGMESLSLRFREKCRDEFWKRVIEIENKDELNRKVNLGRKCKYKIKNIRRGVKNDKY